MDTPGVGNITSANYRIAIDGHSVGLERTRDRNHDLPRTSILSHSIVGISSIMSHLDI